MVVASAIALSSLALAGGMVFLVRTGPLISDLAAAVKSGAPLEARLTGGFRPRRPVEARRSPASADPLSPDARIAIANIDKRAAADRSPRMLGALGVAFLVTGDLERAVATLEDAASAGDADQWSDLSAAYLTKAERMPSRKIEALARALDAAAHAMRMRPSNEARFNRALAIERLSPYVGDSEPWSDYVSHERDPEWLATARRHAAAAVARPDARDAWERRKAQLRTRLAAADLAFARESVTLFPEATWEFFDQGLLLDWARAQMSNDPQLVRSALAGASLTADAMLAVTRDPMAHDTVEAIARAKEGSDQARAVAEAHLAFSQAVKQYQSDDYPAAMASLDRAIAGFAQGRSPYVYWAMLQRATVLFQQRDLGESERVLAAIEDAARRHGYTVLLGRTLRQRGLTQSKQWRLTEALQAFRSAAASFEAGGEFERAVDVYSLIADALRSLGEHHESWEYIGRTLDGLGRVRSPLRRYLILYNASLFASSHDLFDTALLFQDAALREANIRGGAPVVEALTQRAAIFNKQGDRRRALEDLQEAQARLDTVPEGAVKRYEKADIDVLLVALGHSGGYSSQIAGLEDAIRFFAKAEPGVVPRLHLALARAYLAEHAMSAAEDAFDRGIGALEARQATLADEALKISYFDDSWSLFPEMVELQVTMRRDPERAFEYAERSRARLLLAGVGSAAPITLEGIRRALPDATVLVYYVTLKDRLLTWTITREDLQFIETPVGARDLAARVSRYRSALSEDTPGVGADRARLYDALIRPLSSAFKAGDTIVFVPDGDLQSVPFGTLRAGDRDRYLIEDHPVLVAPSASFFVAGVSRARRSGQRPLGSALLVGNPASSSASSTLAPLPGAEAEATLAASYYARHEVLIGSQATKARFLDAAPGFDVVHFGGHAVVNIEYPLLSRLAFSATAGAAGAESLFAYEISRMRLPRTRLVVLAACSTAAGSLSRGEGVVSVARPFLAAGVPLVIGSQWDVDDRATERLFLAFHRSLADTQDPVRALQAAQLSLLRSGSPYLASPVSWGGFVALGAGGH
jgi:CHAT domain-containing protein